MNIFIHIDQSRWLSTNWIWIWNEKTNEKINSNGLLHSNCCGMNDMWNYFSFYATYFKSRLSYWNCLKFRPNAEPLLTSQKAETKQKMKRKRNMMCLYGQRAPYLISMLAIVHFINVMSNKFENCTMYHFWTCFSWNNNEIWSTKFCLLLSNGNVQHVTIPTPTDIYQSETATKTSSFIVFRFEFSTNVHVAFVSNTAEYQSNVLNSFNILGISRLPWIIELDINTKVLLFQFRFWLLCSRLHIRQYKCW